MFLRCTLIALIGGLGTASAHARHALYAITPQESHAGGFTFHITSEVLPDGAVKFQVVITEEQTWFNAHPLTEVGLLKSTQSSRSIEAVRKITGVRKDKSLVCAFTVDPRSLADPDFCFLFSNLENASDNTLLFLIPADFVFARLDEFAPKRRK